MRHGRIESRLEMELDEARSLFNQLSDAGVDYNDVVTALEREGIDKFVVSVNELLAGIVTKRRSLHEAA